MILIFVRIDLTLIYLSAFLFGRAFRILTENILLAFL